MICSIIYINVFSSFEHFFFFFLFPLPPPAMRGKVFLLLSGGLGWTVFAAHRRERLRAPACARVCPRGAVPLGLATKSVSPDVSRGRFAWQAWGTVAAFACRWIQDWRFVLRAWGIVEHVRARSMVGAHFAWQAWLRMHVAAWEGGRWIRVAGVGNRAF